MPDCLPDLRPPNGWTSRVRSAVIHVISLSQHCLAYTRGWAADSINPRLRHRAEVERLRQEVALLREELRIKDERMRRIPARRRPNYLATERMVILDRLLHAATVLNIQGRSYRLRDLEAELAASARAKGAPSPDAADSDTNRPSSHTPRGVCSDS